MFEYMTVREMYEIVQAGVQMEMDQIEYVQLQGWIRTNRHNGQIGFIELNDGTYFKNVQLVYNKGDESYDTCASLNTGDAVNAFGVFKSSLIASKKLFHKVSFFSVPNSLCNNAIFTQACLYDVWILVNSVRALSTTASLKFNGAR